MATTSSAAIQVEHAHVRALEIVREYDSPANAERLEYLDNLGGHLASVNYPAQLSSAQSVLIASLAEIIRDQAGRIVELGGLLEDQGRRITKLEEAAAKPAAAAKRGAKK